MVASLDPHSVYLDKKAFREMREACRASSSASASKWRWKTATSRSSRRSRIRPAYKAGIKAGDLITRIDGTPIKGMSLDEAIKKMRGEPNTKCHADHRRKGEDKPWIVPIVREEIRVQSVKAKIVEPGYAWLRISQFQEPTVDDMAKKISALYAQDPNIKGLVLDLRNDPGGVLPGAIGVSAAFLPKDEQVIVSTNGQLPDSNQTFYGRANSTPARQGRSAGQAAGRAEGRADGGAGQRRLGLGLRNRRRRAAGLQARHHHGQPDLRQGLGADPAPAHRRHRRQADHGALLHAERPLDPGQAASCPTCWSTKPPTATA
jgi:carboxyl-terminal processing protease